MPRSLRNPRASGRIAAPVWGQLPPGSVKASGLIDSHLGVSVKLSACALKQGHQEKLWNSDLSFRKKLKYAASDILVDTWMQNSLTTTSGAILVTVLIQS